MKRLILIFLSLILCHTQGWSAENKKKVCFIVNPISGVGKQKNIEKLVKQNLNHNRFDYDIWFTKEAKHAISLSKEAVDQNYAIIVAVGGDGSVNEVAQGMIGSSSTLAIIPAGSGNGFACQVIERI